MTQWRALAATRALKCQRETRPRQFACARSSWELVYTFVAPFAYQVLCPSATSLQTLPRPTLFTDPSALPLSLSPSLSLSIAAASCDFHPWPPTFCYKGHNHSSPVIHVTVRNSAWPAHRLPPRPVLAVLQALPTKIRTRVSKTLPPRCRLVLLFSVYKCSFS